MPVPHLQVCLSSFHGHDAATRWSRQFSERFSR